MRATPEARATARDSPWRGDLEVDVRGPMATGSSPNGVVRPVKFLDRSRRALSNITLCSLAWAPSGCALEPEGVPEGAVAAVDGDPITRQEIEDLRGQLDAAARLRFSGPEGLRALTAALVDLEVLARQAEAEGYGDDPRVAWALIEEKAAIALSSELVRRIPFEEVQADTQALEAAYAALAHSLTAPERRSMAAVKVGTIDEGEALIATLQAEGLKLEDMGEVHRTRVTFRDDRELPGFHPLLFDPSLTAGDLIPHPIVLRDGTYVGRVDVVEPAHVRPFNDPAVQEELVRWVREQRAIDARREYLHALAASE